MRWSYLWTRSDCRAASTVKNIVEIYKKMSRRLIQSELWERPGLCLGEPLTVLWRASRFLALNPSLSLKRKSRNSSLERPGRKILHMWGVKTGTGYFRKSSLVALDGPP